MRLSCVVTMQKHDHGHRPRIPAIGIADDKPNHFAERLLSSLIAGRRTSFERNRLERIAQFLHSCTAVFCGQQIESAVTVVAPMSNSHAIVGREMIECRTKA